MAAIAVKRRIVNTLHTVRVGAAAAKPTLCRPRSATADDKNYDDCDGEKVPTLCRARGSWAWLR
jgi:hypothetical protein